MIILAKNLSIHKYLILSETNMILWLAPMDWVTDLPCRVITKKIFEKYNDDPNHELYLRSEFMTSDWFLACPENTVKSIINSSFEYPIILQIFGWNKEKLISCALKIQDLYWDKIAWIELNTGCPANNIMKSWWGSALMKDKEKTLDIIKSLSKELTIPFSIKSRTGLDNVDKSRQMDFLIEASHFCDKISVHARTLKELYHWAWDRDFIYTLKSKADKKCKIIWNGWIKSYNEINDKVQNNWVALDGIMVWQAAIWNPRIFTNHEPSDQEKIEIAIDHLKLTAKFEIYLQSLKENWNAKIYPKLEEIENIDIEKNMEKIYYTPLIFRKYLHQYLKGIPWWKDIKQKCNEIRNFPELLKLLNELSQ